jgi:hypothetical protein
MLIQLVTKCDPGISYTAKPSHTHELKALTRFYNLFGAFRILSSVLPLTHHWVYLPPLSSEDLF